jgi:SpoVK/Ycf46/Vps4 family AAA+-type ATPase
VAATSNNVSQLPPELLRKGRFDEIFYVDLPSKDERVEILEIHLVKRNRDAGKYNLERLPGLFTGQIRNWRKGWYRVNMTPLMRKRN